MIEEIKKKFIDLYNSEPKCFRSPGRINIIGEHTDYNLGFVLPAAIDKSIYFALAPNNENKFRFYSFDLEEYIEFTEVAVSETQWANYLLGVIAGFQNQGFHFGTFDLVFGGDLPSGGGFSSSAAIEVGLAYGINQMFHLEIPPMQMVLLAQKAEHDFVGVKCGIMDQFAVMHGKKGNLIQLDCRSLDFSYHPFELENYRFVFADTGVKHNLAENEYNLRREQCESGVKILQNCGHQVESLRDVSIKLLDQHKNNFPFLIYQRCSFVIEENQRLLDTLQVMANGDWASFGKLLYGSHTGLRDKYQVSCEELDVLVESTYGMPQVLGSRMMGGGFGGSTINLVQKGFIDEFENKLQEIYQKHFHRKLKFFEMNLSDGVSQCD